MKIAIAVRPSGDLYVVEPVFGRADMFILVDRDSGDRTVTANPHRDEPEAAGKKTADWLVRQGVKAVLCGDVGPKTRLILGEAGVFAGVGYDGTVDDALARYLSSL
ncbi:MAG: dinitrogenase iron-molybdenum cofactor biosynthesis protein [Desulfovibrionales bacterium]|nr:dinitrogenase iron-molybdenum cofactor biosynthesis protein [Desulfovibrionales bacterium]